MHIVMLSDFETQGGAAIAASRLATGLVQAGQRVTRLVMAADGNRHVWQILPLSPTRFDRAVQRFAPQALATRWLEPAIQSHLEKALATLQPDLINLHGLHGAAAAGWSPTLAQVCAKIAPVIWTLHDMWSFTGRCAYAGDCRKFIQGCDATCPTPNEYPALAPRRIAGAWRHRQALFESCPGLSAVSPSRWLAQEAQAGLWAGHRIEMIPNGLPLDVYTPTDRQRARQLLGLETTGPVLLISARRFNRHKGADLFVEALSKLSGETLTVLVMGRADFAMQAPRQKIIQLGYIDDESKKALVYSAADLLVHPAVNDNLPNVVMEALACATPVASFAIGGVPDMVRPGQTGWLAESVSAEALAQLLRTILADAQPLAGLAPLCRQVAEADYGVQLQAQRYLVLAHSLSQS